jgi:hypothetical protein
MTLQQARGIAGLPSRTCVVQNTAIDGVAACFSGVRVLDVVLDVHG